MYKTEEDLGPAPSVISCDDDEPYIDDDNASDSPPPSVSSPRNGKLNAIHEDQAAVTQQEERGEKSLRNSPENLNSAQRKRIEAERLLAKSSIIGQWHAVQRVIKSIEYVCACFTQVIVH